MTCGHSICDVCVEIFGIECSGVECQYEVQACTLCTSGRVVVRLKPPSAGVSILSIDGGGIRGVIPLEFLNRLQQTIGDCPVQDLFDLAFGTSAGKSLAG